MTKEHFYISENSLDFTGDSYYEEIIETQITNQETLIELGRGTEIVFENEKLIEVYEYYEDNRDIYRRKKEIATNELNYRKPIYQPKSILKSIISTSGLHQIGGDFSDDFYRPSEKISTSFQYLGYINNEDPTFSWLPYKLHLTYPIYLAAEILFLDYSDNKKPKLFNLDELLKCSPILDEVDINSEISFIPQNFNFQPSNNYCLEINSGIPNWIQGHYIPKCPKSGKRMQFVCQIYNGSQTEKSNIVPASDWNKNYFEKMEFFGADLYIFIEPESNIVCMFTQGT